MGETEIYTRGSIAFFSVYKPPVPLDLFSCSVAQLHNVQQGKLLPLELHLTDSTSYNYNGQVIPPAALKTLLQRPKLASVATSADVDLGLLTGLIFVSERDHNLETLHIALHHNTIPSSPVQIFSLADIFGTELFGGVRMEDSGCFAGGYAISDVDTADHFLIYVSTKEPVTIRRSPWTVVYKTNLTTGETKPLSPPDTFDLNPAVSPSGKLVAMASFQNKGWNGEIDDLNTDIYVMNLDSSQSDFDRKILIEHGGWPTWGSENVIFFHRKEDGIWGVFRFDITTGEPPIRVTPKTVNAVTPAAIDETRVAVSVLPDKVKSINIIRLNEERTISEYRHIVIYDTNYSPPRSIQITQEVKPMADHFNPFVIDGGKRIGYHRCNPSFLESCQDPNLQNFYNLLSPLDNVGLFRVSGAFPTISPDGSKLAFVDNEFKAVWIADSDGLRSVLSSTDGNSYFAPMWNQKKDTLYVCAGPSFSPEDPLQLIAIRNVSSAPTPTQLTYGHFNNAFPASDKDGNRLVFRSTLDKDGTTIADGDKDVSDGDGNRDGDKDGANSDRDGDGEGDEDGNGEGDGDGEGDDDESIIYKNLFIIEDEEVEDGGKVNITRLTEGNWIDTHCQWSPQGDWIVFSSTRDKPTDATKLDHGLDPGYFAVYLVSASNNKVVVRVLTSADSIAGHVNHPVFSPDGQSIVVTADLAAVSADPISLPQFLHSVRPYGDIFTIKLIDTQDITNNNDVQQFLRITHSKYENSTPTWTMFSTNDPQSQWKIPLTANFSQPSCPYIYANGGHGWHTTGHLCVKKRIC